MGGVLSSQSCGEVLNVLLVVATIPIAKLSDVIAAIRQGEPTVKLKQFAKRVLGMHVSIFGRIAVAMGNKTTENNSLALKGVEMAPLVTTEDRWHIAARHARTRQGSCIFPPPFRATLPVYSFAAAP